jgi:hypothetical protein
MSAIGRLVDFPAMTNCRRCKRDADRGGLIERFRDDQKRQGIEGARALGDRFGHIKSASEIPPSERPAVRNDLNHVLEQLKVLESKAISDAEKKQTKSIHDDLMKSVEYVPWCATHHSEEAGKAHADEHGTK